MKHLILFSLLIITLTGDSQQKTNPEFLHTRNQKILDRHGENVLLRGIGLGGHMLQEGILNYERPEFKSK